MTIITNKEKLERETKEKADLFNAVFTSEQGAKVLELLEKELNPDVIIGENNDITNYNLGRRDVLIYIRQMINYSER